MTRDRGRTLWLHVGHGKTGSSYLQSLFALNRDRLAARGIVYPAHRELKAAAAGETTVGNASRLRRRLRHPVTAIAAGALHRFGRRDVLLSNETLMNALSRRKRRRNLMRFAAAGGFERIRVLLFIRDPDEHFLSFWGQMIRREGETRDIDAMIDAYPTPARVARFLEGAAEEPAVDVTVRNYSRVRATLTEEVAAWLGAPSDGFLAPPAAVVNRSLSFEELAVQRALNQRFGPCGERYGDPVAARPPRKPATRPRLTEAQRAAIRAAIARPMRRVNALAPPEHRYRMIMETTTARYDMSVGAFSDAQREDFESASGI